LKEAIFSYVGDGRFHLEAIMIANPTVPAFRYDPYSKTLTRERYAYREMHAMRDDAIQSARRSIFTLSNRSSPLSWGVILGTLGRQGNLNQFNGIIQQLSQHSTPGPIPHVPILLSELSPAKLALFEPHITAFVQTACPRLSIDWGYAFEKPLLSPYECAVALRQVKGWMDRDGEAIENHDPPAYPMDFYEAGSLWALSRTMKS
jgi:2-(3-amino-3-carboxypropyl)histidine synthase